MLLDSYDDSCSIHVQPSDLPFFVHFNDNHDYRMTQVDEATYNFYLTRDRRPHHLPILFSVHAFRVPERHNAC